MDRLRLLRLLLGRVVVAVVLIAPVWGGAWWYVTHTPRTYATEVFMINSVRGWVPLVVSRAVDAP